MYTGVVMRMAYVVESEQVAAPAPQRLSARGPARDPYGWSAAGARR
jgi:hypothetical protein